MGACSSQEADNAIDSSRRPRIQPPVGPGQQMLPPSRSPKRGARVMTGSTTGGDRESLTSDNVGYFSRAGEKATSSCAGPTGTVPESPGTPVGKRGKPRTPAWSWTAESQRSPYGVIPLRGDAVAIVGLRKSPEYNGRVGVVKLEPLHNQLTGRCNLKRKPRYSIVLPGWSQVLNLQLENLCVLEKHTVPVQMVHGRAGIEFHKDDCGWLVTRVSREPGQPSIRRRDIVIAVEETSLMHRTEREQVQIMKERFVRDGVMVTVLRTPLRNRSRRERARLEREKRKDKEREPRKLPHEVHERISELYTAVCRAAGQDVRRALKTTIATIRLGMEPGTSRDGQLEAWVQSQVELLCARCGISRRGDRQRRDRRRSSQRPEAKRHARKKSGEALISSYEEFVALFEAMNCQWPDEALLSGVEGALRESRDAVKRPISRNGHLKKHSAKHGVRL